MVLLAELTDIQLQWLHRKKTTVPPPSRRGRVPAGNPLTGIYLHALSELDERGADLPDIFGLQHRMRLVATGVGAGPTGR
ncbi:hypothetical protein [Kitasatospora sp. NPDC059803]|uniref:hypothetical protein n=1 Tax=Kitasatospora sp. NPDC059803 TaxID=3346953 RepID=UPI00365BCF5B